MTGGLALLGLALVGFAAMGVLHKLGDRLKCQPVAVAAVTMSAGVGIAATKAATATGSDFASLPLTVPLLAVPFGLLAAAALGAFQAGVRHGTIATSWLLLNLSVAIPTGLSVALYGDAVAPKTAAALGLIALAVVLVWLDAWRAESRKLREGAASCGSD